MSALACAASPLDAKNPLGVYYSFDTPPPPAVVREMQSELSRIFTPSGISATWIRSDAPRVPGEDFPGIVVFRFSGHCTIDDFENDSADVAGQALAQADTVDGHVLPFARVDCERVRALIAPNLKAMPPDWKTEMLGRALARVSAHEIYHMLAGVETHSDSGIFQAGHSRRDLTAATFSFAEPENDWLRRWLQRQAPLDQVAHAQTPDASGEPVLNESDSDDFAGR